MQAREQINLYIAERPEAQRKVLVRLRQLIHSADESIVESWRANAPHFEHQGGPIIGLSTNRHGINVTFDEGSAVKDPKNLFEPCAEGRDCRTYRIKDEEVLQEAAFLDLVKKALSVRSKAAKEQVRPVKRPSSLNTDLETVLRKDPTAWANWEGFSPADREDYLEWVQDGPREETCKRRMAQALEMIREGISKAEDYHGV